jgi:hypothetical protein
MTRGVIATAVLLPCLLAGGLTPGAARAQDPPAVEPPQRVGRTPEVNAPFRVPRLHGTIVLDGRSDEAAWQGIEPLPAVASFPDFGAEPSERTEFRLAYDDEYLYVAGRLYDRDVAGIRATSLRRDDASFSNDWFVINLDTYLDRETTIVIGVSPAGVRTDAVFSNDGAAVNFDWNAFWDARAVVAEDGWHAEIRIPLSTLRFEERDGAVLMGVTIWRRIARRNEMISWPAVEHRWGTFSIFKASQTAVVALEGVRRRNPVYVVPYLLAGGSRTHALDAGRTAWQPSSDWTHDAGLDVKYSPASNIALDITVNTDFAQVEADDQQVNLTRFSLFFPEKRLFFQERASVFGFGMGGSDRLFYSRRIGLEQGRPVRIYGGGRAVARFGEWDVAALDLQTATAAEGTSRNDGVIRIRRRMLNDNSYAGGIITSRMDSDGSRHLSAGADAIVRVHGQDYLDLGMATTSSPGDSLAGADRLFGRARIERRGVYGITYAAEAAYIGAEFLPALGFLARRDVLRASSRLGWGVRMPQASSLLRQSLDLEGGAHWRNADGGMESGEVAASWGIVARTGSTLTLAANARREDLVAPFRLGPGAIVPPGTYDFAGGRISFVPADAALLRVSASIEAGTFYDGRRVSGALTPTWLQSRHLQLSGTWQVNRLEFATRDERLTAHVARVRALVMASASLSAVAFVQYNSVADAVVLNARVRWNPAEGNDLYIVFNQGMNTDRYEYAPVRPIVESRALLFKYSRTARF